MIASLSSNAECLECPVCLQIPRQEIYQCANGHSICNICISQLEICPTCRVEISGSIDDNVRNYYAEGLLDAMTFACNWKAQGCQQLVARNKLTDHEAVCKFGKFNICGYEGYEDCQFQFSTFLLNQAENLKEVVDHFKSAHDFTVLKMDWGSVWKVQLENAFFNEILESDKSLSSMEARFFEVGGQHGSNHENIRNDVFLLLVHFDEDLRKQKLFKFAFAMLTSETAEETISFKVKVCIKGEPKPEISNEWGENYVPDIKWTMIPMSTQKLKAFYKMSVDEQPSFPFSLPISHIQKHYIDSDDKFNLQFSFHYE